MFVMSAEVFSLVSNILHWGVFGLLAFAFLSFLFRFVRPGLRIAGTLKEAHRLITRIKGEGNVVDLDRVAREAMLNIQLTHCWSEYRDTLHGQKRPDEFGTLQVVRWRATAAAQGFFTEQSLIDGPLRTEFYKHLPGMLTGLGIIGTFSGLILGLQGFQVTDNADQVRTSLATLIQSVGGAFLVSGAAILLAMLVTLLEKALINRLYTANERLCGLIDSLFDAGAGEEYLQRLVEASETSATQTMQMKESLVTDLKQVLTELTHQQIATMTANSQQLGQNIADSLKEGLKDPLERISDAVQVVGNSQGDAMNRLLTDVLSSFAAKMEGMFGGQLKGMNELLSETARTISTAAQRFDQMASEIREAGSGASEAMARRMDEALAQMQVQQAAAGEQMRLFIDQMKSDMAKGQSESFERTAAMMKELADTTGALVRGLQDQAQNSHEDHARRQLQATEQMRDFLKELTATMAATQAASIDATRALVDDLKAQALSAQQEGAEQQKQATEQMRSFVDQVKAEAVAERQATEQATDSMVRGIREQGAAAANAHVQREHEAAERMREFLDGMRDSWAASQNETSRTSNKLLQDLGSAAEGLVARLQSQTATADVVHNERQAALAAQATEILAQQGDQINQLTNAVQSAVSAVRDAAGQVATTTRSHLDLMSDGAQRLAQASDRLVGNLGAMRTGTDGLVSSADRLNVGASTLSTAVATVEQTMNDHKSVRDGLATVVADLRLTIENAKREASFTKDLLDGLEVASQRLVDAQRTTEGYLEGVSEVLEQAHAEFASNMQITLQSSNSAFHEELAQAVNYLKGAIQDLGDVLDAMPARG
jgi:hypothetical protein